MKPSVQARPRKAPPSTKMRRAVRAEDRQHKKRATHRASVKFQPFSTLAPSEMGQINRLERTSFGSFYRPHRFRAADFQRYLAHDSTIGFVACQHQRLIGYVLGRMYLRHGERNARIDSLAVAREYRQQGIGKSLVARFLREAARRGCRRVGLEASQDNTAASALYGGLRFERDRHIENYYGPGKDAYTLFKGINPKSA